MSYDDYLSSLPDEDPEGESQDERELADSCPDCGVDADTPCTPECGCVYCRRRELAQKGDAA